MKRSVEENPYCQKLQDSLGQMYPEMLYPIADMGFHRSNGNIEFVRDFLIVIVLDPT